MVMQTHLSLSIRAKNIQTVIVARFFQGAFGSTAATMVGGTIADIWLTKEYVFFDPYFVYNAKTFCNKARCTDGPFHLDCYRRDGIGTCLCRLDCNQPQPRMEMVTVGPYDVSHTSLKH